MQRIPRERCPETVVGFFDCVTPSLHFAQNDPHVRFVLERMPKFISGSRKFFDRIYKINGMDRILTE